MRLIGFVGKKRTGKDTCADFLSHLFHDFHVLAFAEPVKQACKHIYALSDDQVFEGKDVVDERWSLTPRDMLKKLGTDMRSVDRFHWVRNMAMRLDGIHSDANTYVAISDVRYHEEADYIRNMGGLLIHISRDSAEDGDLHVSETESGGIVCDHYIYNNGTLDELKAIVASCVSAEAN